MECRAAACSLIGHGSIDGKGTTVLNLTPQAADAIQILLHEQDGGGLRISIGRPQGEDSRPAMVLSLSSDPDPGDEVVSEHGSKVFVEHRLAAALADKTLDLAQPEADGRVGFRLVS